ncbi:unnamed protein product [Medioppia subpectinata]|uniref:Uncharacterized protein n=1 Tax=Medioppia subpectinata TaxID=1979941 RepID=A0A7R9PZV0_9ACAR|nr:unnamed protein product [Medioppia subpectinata]CAG2107400.1 unnamed protein product [Medioppia subpectinata]
MITVCDSSDSSDSDSDSSSDSGSCSGHKHHKKHHKHEDKKHGKHDHIVYVPVQTPTRAPTVIYRPLPVQTSVVRVEFDLITLLIDNGFGQVVQDYQQSLVTLGTNMRSYFTSIYMDADNFDFYMNGDMADMLDSLGRGLAEFRARLRDQSSDIVYHCKFVEDVLGQLRDYTRQTFSIVVTKERETKHCSVFRDTKLADTLVTLSGNFGQYITDDNDHAFHRVLNGFYSDIDNALNRALNARVVRVSAGRQLPVQYSYLQDFSTAWNRVFDRIKVTFYKDQPTACAF